MWFPGHNNSEGSPLTSELMKIELTHSEIATIIASTYHQYRAEKEGSDYQKQIKEIHKKLSVLMKNGVCDYSAVFVLTRKDVLTNKQSL